MDFLTFLLVLLIAPFALVFGIVATPFLFAAWVITISVIISPFIWLGDMISSKRNKKKFRKGKK